MSSHEDLLRQALQAEADDIRPRLDHADVLARAQRRPSVVSLSRWPRPLTAVAAIAAATIVVLGVLALADRDRGGEVRVADPDPMTPTTVPAAPSEDPGQGIYPFTNGAEADRWADENADRSSGYFAPESTALDFAETYLGMATAAVVSAGQGDSRSFEVGITNRTDGPVTTVLLRKLGSSDALTVIGATTPNIVLSSPAAMDLITSPVHIEGQASAYEGNVLIQVREDGMIANSEALAVEPLTGSSGPDLGPMTGDVVFMAPSEDGGAIVAITYSARDDAPEEATVVRVLFHQDRPAPDPGADPSTTIVAARADGSVMVVDTEGHERTLTESTGRGLAGIAVSPDGSTAWISRAVTDCHHELVEIDVATGTEAVIGDGRWPAASIDGRLAYATDPECDGEDALVVRTLATGGEETWPDLPLTGADTSYDLAISHLTFAPDGHSVVYQVAYEDGTGLQRHQLDPEHTTVTGNAERLEPADYDPPASQDYVWENPAFDEKGDLWVSERCCGLNAGPDQTASATSVRLVPIGHEGDPANGWAVEVPGPIAHLSARGLHVLITGSDGEVYIAGRDGMTKVISDALIAAW